jgi:hypothetical protein
MISDKKVSNLRNVALFVATLVFAAFAQCINATDAKRDQTRVSQSTMRIEAAFYTNGTYGDLYKLMLPGGDGVELEVVSFLSPMGKVSGSYFADSVKVRALAEAIVIHQFSALPSRISTKNPVPFHAPEYRLSVTLDGKTHRVLLVAPQFKSQTEEAKRFVAVWNAVFELVPVNVRPPQIRFQN